MQMPKLEPLVTKEGHLEPALVKWRAEGHEMSGINEEHLKECVPCQRKVQTKREAFMLQQAQPVDSTLPTIPPEKRRINKMGRSNSEWLNRLSAV